MMKIRDLIEALEEAAEMYPDAEVRLATQPRYPLQSHIMDGLRIVRGVVFIRESSQVRDTPYANEAYGEYDISEGDVICRDCGAPNRDIDTEGENPQCGYCFEPLESR